MKKIIALVLVSFLAIIFSCVTTRSHHKAMHNKDHEIMDFLLAVNQYEIDAAHDVMSKLHTEAVKDFANYMIEEHSKNLADAKKLSAKDNIEPTETAETVHLKQKTNEDLAALKAADENNVEEIYIEQMINGHREVLAKIDTLLEEVSNPDLKAFLELTREHVAHHLERAKDLRK
jgi:putative membrane protein